MLIVTRTAAAIAAAASVGALASRAGAAPAAADLQLDIGASTTVTQNPPVTPNGGTVRVTSLDFRVDVNVALVTLSPVRATIRVTLDDRLRWAASDVPDPTEGCTSTPTTASCETPELRSVAGQSIFGWNWPVTAPGPGSYAYRAEIAQASDTDPEPGNNASAILILVSPAAPSPSPTPRPAAPARAGAVTLVPRRPRAGVAVTARVAVTAGGRPIRPSGVACAGSIGTTKLRGVRRAATGRASCTFRTPRSAAGKTLRGSVAFRARGQRFQKRFAVKLR